jgi:hypothetical protein
MNARQMVEHLSEYIEHANGKRKMQVLTEQEKLPAFRSFLFSEKEFKPGTPNSQMPETPEQVNDARAKNHGITCLISLARVNELFDLTLF